MPGPAVVGADARIGPPRLPRAGGHNHAATSFL